jgi:protein-S-isoprenylcysteine O-methyltransferase Ste14
MMDVRDRPNTIPWPPILFVGALVAANVLGSYAPLPLGFRAWFVQPLGALIVVLALSLMVWSFMTFRAEKTTILPHQAAERMIVRGPFAISRNPIYLSEVILMVGLSLANASLWYALITPLFMAAVTKLAIVREEAHLAARFGADWAAYAGRVRRWV